MKKLLTLLAVAAVGVSASAADYYLVGGFNGWSNPSNEKFTAGANGVYTLQYKGELSGQFKITDGTWTDANCYGSNGSAVVLGQPYQLVQPAPAGDGGNMTFAAGAVKDPKFELNTTTGTLLVTGANAEVSVTYVIHGNFVTGEWADLTLTNNNGTWEAKNVVAKTGEFGIKENTNGSQSNWFAAPTGEATIVPGKSVTCTNSGPTNFSIAAGTYNFAFNASTKVLTVTDANGGGGTVTPTPDPAGVSLYLVGDVNDWTTSANYEFKYQGDGKYVLTLTALNGQFKVKDADPDWKGINLGGDTGGLDVPTVDAVVGDNTLWQGSSVNLVANNWTNVTLTLSYYAGQESATLNVSTDGQGGGSDTPVNPTPDPTGTTLYLVGKFNDWTLADAKYAFTAKGNNTYTLSLASLNGEFKINDGTWNGINLGGDTGGLDVPTVDAVVGDNTLWQGSSVNLVANNWTNVVLTLTYDGSDMATLNVSTDGQGGGSDTPVTPTPDPTGTTLYLVGKFNDWTLADAKYAFTAKGNNTYTLSLASLNGEFKINDGTWNGINLGGDTGGLDVPTVDAVVGDNTLWQGSSVNLVANNWTNVVLTLTYDGSDMATLNVSTDGQGGGSDTPVTPTPDPTGTTLYLVGKFNEWALADALYAFKAEGNNTYTLWLASLNGEFKINDGTWNGINLGGDTGGEDVPTVDAVVGVNTLWQGSSVNLVANDWKEVLLTLTYDGSDMATLNVKTGVDGVAGIEVENAPVEYYNLQGVRVNNPENGIFIRVQGNSVSKVIVK